ncbi:hypothetical protein PR048_029349 [Dryococelus australis]|uniref:Uncharacterized protein n=1 Tax=Dryococelus australis TaxID=614101 RepID=A0ABQ9GFS0_9NEOP|nr:hypothetical protein PR048_029349 [Dryococelus australis]
MAVESCLQVIEFTNFSYPCPLGTPNEQGPLQKKKNCTPAKEQSWLAKCFGTPFANQRTVTYSPAPTNRERSTARSSKTSVPIVSKETPRQIFFCTLTYSVLRLRSARPNKDIPGAGMNGRGKREIHEEICLLMPSSGTILTCESPVTGPGIEPGSPWWEASEPTGTAYNPFTVTSHFSEALLKFYFQDIPPPLGSGESVRIRGELFPLVEHGLQSKVQLREDEHDVCKLIRLILRSITVQWFPWASLRRLWYGRGSSWSLVHNLWSAGHWYSVAGSYVILELWSGGYWYSVAGSYVVLELWSAGHWSLRRIEGEQREGHLQTFRVSSFPRQPSPLPTKTGRVEGFPKAGSLLEILRALVSGSTVILRFKKFELGVAVLGTRPFVLREYVYVDALGRRDVYFTFPAPLHSIMMSSGWPFLVEWSGGIWAALNIEVSTADCGEASMGQCRNARAEETGRTPRKAADQQHRPTRDSNPLHNQPPAPQIGGAPADCATEVGSLAIEGETKRLRNCGITVFYWPRVNLDVSNKLSSNCKPRDKCACVRSPACPEMNSRNVPVPTRRACAQGAEQASSDSIVALSCEN